MDKMDKNPIRAAIEESGMTQEQIAKELNVSRQAVSRWAAGNPPTFANLQKLAQLLKTTVGRLSGEPVSSAAVAAKIDAMTRGAYTWQSEIKSDSAEEDGEPDSLEDATEEIRRDVSSSQPDDLVMIPLIDVYGSCGYGSGDFAVEGDAVQLIGCRPTTAKSWPGVTGIRNLHMIHIIGDSMEPTLKKRGEVIVDGSQTRIFDDGIYVIQSEGQIFVKRVQRNLDGTLTLLSDNKHYPPMHVPKAVLPSLRILGRVIRQVNIDDI